MKKEIRLNIYDSFVCTASDCPFTCCQEWTIAVDDATYACWENQLKLDVVTTVMEQKSGGGHQIALNTRRECPYLTEDHLCSLVIEHGADVLSDTCARFPREIHEFANRTEKTLVSCCPEVVDQLAGQPIRLVQDDPLPWGITEQEQDDRLLYELRHDMMKLLENKQYDLNLAYRMIFYIQLDVMQHYYEDAEWIYDSTQYFEEKILWELAKTIRALPVDWRATLCERNELFLDLVENYREQGMYAKALESVLKQAKELELLLSSPEKEKATEQGLVDVYQNYVDSLSEYEDLFRNFLINELFTSLVKPLSDVESVTVMLQWIGMEWGTLLHVLFLQWLTDDHQLAYEGIREWIVLISRMMGYDEDDIFEYMEDCFETRIWEWGYLNLLLP